MQAFNNNADLKAAMVEETELHRQRDQIIKGSYEKRDGTTFKGCSIGCSIHSYNLRFGKQISTNNHSAFETELQIPTALARINDWIFERLPDEQAQTWPSRFFEAIPVGADLRFAHGQFFAWTLLDDEIGFWKLWKYPEDQKAFQDFGKFIEYLATDLPYKKTEWDSVRKPFLARLDRLDRLDSLARLARLDSLDRLARLDRLDRLARLDSLASLDRLARLDSAKIAVIASKKLLSIMAAAKPEK